MARTFSLVEKRLSSKRGIRNCRVWVLDEASLNYANVQIFKPDHHVVSSVYGTPWPK
jgi:hypothetical protein